MRLTFNYWRRGGYSIGSEDYRWDILRQYISAPLFFIFNVVFISTAQPVLLFIITAPTYLLLLTTIVSPQWSTGDLIFSRVMVGCVLLAFFADQQQYNYQTAKHEYRRTAKIPAGSKYDQDDFERGFNVSGLWAWSRHPNFLAEQAFWVSLYQWACWESDTLWNWTGVGALSYLILFQSSTWLTELITARKYEQYAEYQKLVGKFVPKRLATFEEGSKGVGESKEKK